MNWEVNVVGAETKNWDKMSRYYQFTDSSITWLFDSKKNQFVTHHEPSIVLKIKRVITVGKKNPKWNELYKRMKEIQGL